MPTPKTNYWSLDRVMWLIIGLSLSIGIIWLIYYLRDALLPFFVACVIAYILQPVVNFNMRLTHIRNRALVSVLTLIEVGGLVAVLMWLTLPSIIDELGKFNDTLHAIAIGKIKLPDTYGGIVEVIRRYFDPERISETLQNMQMQKLMERGTSLLQASTKVLLHTLAWLLTIIYVLFILIDFDEIKSGFKQIVPQRWRPEALKVFNDMALGMNHYFRGQGKVALCAMVFYCTGFLIIKLPLAIPMGITVGILYMIPYFQYVTLIPVAAICLMSSIGGGEPFLTEFLKSLAVYAVSQCICDYLITPHVMGKELGLNPAVILLSLSVWGSLLGIIGMIIALPVTALIMQYYQTYISNRK